MNSTDTHTYTECRVDQLKAGFAVLLTLLVIEWTGDVARVVLGRSSWAVSIQDAP